jgi:hypothetical protein
LRLKSRKDCFGFGLEAILNTISSWANKCIQATRGESGEAFYQVLGRARLMLSFGCSGKMLGSGVHTYFFLSCPPLPWPPCSMRFRPSEP